MKPLERRLSALEAVNAKEDGEHNWPWVRLIWKRGEPEPVVPPRHNGIVVKIVSPGDPPEWLSSACVTVTL